MCAWQKGMIRSLESRSRWNEKLMSIIETSSTAADWYDDRAWSLDLFFISFIFIYYRDTYFRPCRCPWISTLRSPSEQGRPGIRGRLAPRGTGRPCCPDRDKLLLGLLRTVLPLPRLYCDREKIIYKLRESERISSLTHGARYIAISFLLVRFRPRNFKWR